MNSKTIIVDLDGTLAFNKHRFHFIDKSLGHKVDWNTYFEACDKDSPNTSVIETIKALKLTGYQIHIFSARGDIVRDKTIKWLSKYDVPYDQLTMREMNSFTPDEELKKSWLLSYYPNYKEEVLCVYDDRDKVVKMWRSLGLSCFQVAEGDF
jgi:phosphoglycolate phosphatase-like HAD superfamily hydrolase